MKFIITARKKSHEMYVTVSECGHERERRRDFKKKKKKRSVRERKREGKRGLIEKLKKSPEITIINKKNSFVRVSL